MIWLSTLLSIVEAAEIASVDRPTIGASAYTLERGGIQLESGLQIDGSQSGSVYSLPAMLRLGLHDRIELRPYTSILSYSESDTLALQSSGLQSKFKLYAPDNQNLAVSILASSDMNAGSSTLLLDAWKEDWCSWINTGYTLDYNTNAGTSLVLAGFGYTLPNQQGLFIESSAVFSGSTSATLEGGYTKTFKQIQVDLYALTDLTNPQTWQIATGVGWRLR